MYRIYFLLSGGLCDRSGKSTLTTVRRKGMRTQGTVGAEVLHKVLCPTEARSARKGGNLDKTGSRGKRWYPGAQQIFLTNLNHELLK